MSEPRDQPLPQTGREEFPRNTGAGGRVAPDRPPPADLSPDPEANIIPSDAPGG